MGTADNSQRKRILFVDDDALLLRMYGIMLEDEAHAWDVVMLEDAHQAVDLLKGSAFDVVVSDMWMPGMNGAQLMSEVRNRHPRTSRVILSGVHDQQEIAQTLQATHQFVPKPFDPIKLKTTLTQLAGLNGLLADQRLQTLVAELDALPSFPSIYLEILGELDSEEPSIEKISAIMMKDPGLTAKILQVANSAVFGLAHQVSSPFEAVQYLGLSAVKSLTLSIHIFSNFGALKRKGFSMDRLCDHSMRTGRLARAILLLEEERDAAEDAFTAGMLHDIGKLMLADNLPEDFERALELAAERGITLHEAEFEVFGSTHSAVGAYLLGLWGLPSSIVEAVAFHHAPGVSTSAAFGAVGAVHCASIIENAYSQAPTAGKAADFDLAYLSSFAKHDRVEAWKAKADDILLS